jgi:hypothetical protein
MAPSGSSHDDSPEGAALAKPASLRELGYDRASIGELRREGVIA